MEEVAEELVRWAGWMVGKCLWERGGSSRGLYLLRTCSVAAVSCASGGAVGDRLGEGSE